MIKQWIRNIPFSWKFGTLLILALFIVSGSLYMAASRISFFLYNFLKINLDPFSLIRTYFLDILWISLLAVLLIFGALFWEIFRFSRAIKHSIQEGLVDRKLDHYLDQFYSGKSLGVISDNLHSFLSLLRSFDQMKSKRLALEFDTIKTLLNNVSSGVLLLNKDKIVTHINHEAEVHLKLVPGEIVGEIISRKITNTTLLDLIEDAIEKDRKVYNEDIEFKDGRHLSLGIIPLKNRYNELSRIIVILDNCSAQGKS